MIVMQLYHIRLRIGSRARGDIEVLLQVEVSVLKLGSEYSYNPVTHHSAFHELRNCGWKWTLSKNYRPRSYEIMS